MAVVPMSKINIFGLRKNRKKILEAIQCMGVVDVRTFEKSDTGFEGVDTVTVRSQFKKAKNDCESSLRILQNYTPEKKSMFASFNGRDLINSETYEDMVRKRDRISDEVSKILKLDKLITDEQARCIKLEENIVALTPWRDMPIPLNCRGTHKTTVFAGTFPQAFSDEALLKQFTDACVKKELEEISKNVHIEVVGSTETQTCALIICSKAQATETEEVLRYMGFAAPPLMCDGLPSGRIKAFENEIEAAKANIKKAEKQICDSVQYRKAIKFLIDYYTMRIDKYRVIEQLGHSQSVFVLSGYIPAEKAESLEMELAEKCEAAMECIPADGDDVPVFLENNSFAAPLEGVLETFSLPGRGELDPTAAMAVFYYFLFGLMLSDAAYGVLMVLTCGIVLWKFPKMKDGLRRSFKMYLYCGISTTFWGVMFGSYFGDAVQVIAKTFFNKDIVIEPLWFSPINEPMRMLIFSLLIGIIHLFAGLGLKLYSFVRIGKWKDAIYDVIFWYMLVGGAIVYLLSLQVFVDMTSLDFKLSTEAGNAAAITAVTGAIGIASTAGRASRNPFKRLAKGLYELYNVTGYLSDILSYSRLLALGLATGVIANVFNKMGSMFGSGVVGVIAFTLVFIAGHTLNIGINLLGAYVHTNRLQFVEFFGKFYEGGGEKYKPFKARTDYYEIK